MTRAIRFPLAMLSLLAFVLIGFTVAPSSARSRPRPRPQPRQLVSVQLLDGSGHGLRTFQHRGSTFVLGDRGQRYRLRITNRSNERLEVVASIDGLDALSGKSSAAWRDRGYVVGPRDSVTIEGFRTSLASVAAFRFSDPADSYARRKGLPHALGIIRVSVFREHRARVLRKRKRWQSRPQLRRPSRPQARPPAPSSRSKSSAGESRRRHRPKAGNLGTRFGERRDSQVMEVAFRRDRRGTAQVVLLRYDDEAGLAARGVAVGRGWNAPPPRWSKPRPHPHPRPRSQFAQPPPPRWR